MLLGAWTLSQCWNCTDFVLSFTSTYLVSRITVLYLCTFALASRIMVLRVGSDFSGLDTAYWALRRRGVPFRHVFACDCDGASLKVLRFLQPEVIYEDVRSRNVAEMPEVDIFTFGPPCQSYSRQGNRAQDSCEMGQLGIFSLAYILHCKPRIALMEQVKDVVHSGFFQLVLSQLANAGYNLYSQILKSSDYGVPQTRERVYLVALLNPVSEFTFPDPVPCCSATSLIDQLPPERFQMVPDIGPAGGETRQKNVLEQLQCCIESGVNPYEAPVFISSGASSSRCNYMVGQCMTITRTEALRQGFWCTTKGGFLEPHEVARFQGFPDNFLDWRSLGITDSHFCALLGNAMTFNVLLHLLPSLLRASGSVSNHQANQMIRTARAHHPRRAWAMII